MCHWVLSSETKWAWAPRGLSSFHSWLVWRKLYHCIVYQSMIDEGRIGDILCYYKSCCPFPTMLCVFCRIPNSREVRVRRLGLGPHCAGAGLSWQQPGPAWPVATRAQRHKEQLYSERSWAANKCPERGWQWPGRHVRHCQRPGVMSVWLMMRVSSAQAAKCPSEVSV